LAALLVGTYTYPSSSSTLIADHVLPLPVYFQEFLSHVSTPYSPARGTMWNCQRSVPVLTS
jgi:hypothetical protein